MPDNEAFISGARATLLVRADVGAPWGYLGGPRMIDVSSDGTTVDFEAEWVEPPGLSLVTTYQLSYRTDPQDHESAELIVDGPPQAGSFEPGFLSPAVLTTPRTGHPLHDPIRWDLPAGQTHQMTQLMLSSAIGGGGMALLGNETEVTIPVLPSTSSEAAVFADPVTLVLQIQGCSDVPGPCSAVSRDKPAQLTP
jgi:hypothetical protein